MRLKKAFILIPLYALSVSLLGGYFVRVGKDPWYQSLNLPWYTPPDWLFGIAWNLIFIAATCSALRVYTTVKSGRTRFILLSVFFINGLLNAFWSFLFFFHHQIGYALIDAVILEFTVFFLLYLLFQKGQKTAYLLLLPYALWMIFAIILNIHIWLIN